MRDECSGRRRAQADSGIQRRQGFSPVIRRAHSLGARVDPELRHPQPRNSGPRSCEQNACCHRPSLSAGSHRTGAARHPRSGAQYACAAHTCCARPAGALQYHNVTSTLLYGTVRSASAGQVTTAINASAAGDTVICTGGAQQKLTLSKSFPAPGITIRCDSGSYFEGIDTNGQSGLYIRRNYLTCPR